MSTVVFPDGMIHRPLSVREPAPQMTETFPLVVVANEPVSYRSLLATELPFLRPNLRVLEVPPAMLNATVASLQPAVVVCSQASAQVRDSEAALVFLRAGKIDSYLQTPAGTIVNPRLADILGAIDRAVLTGTPRSNPLSAPLLAV